MNRNCYFCKQTYSHDIHLHVDNKSGTKLLLSNTHQDHCSFLCYLTAGRVIENGPEQKQKKKKKKYRLLCNHGKVEEFGILVAK